MEPIPRRFAGKIVVATGVTQGIGRAIVQRFVREGASVVGGARRAAGLEDLEKALGPAFVGVPTDVPRERDVERLVASAVEKFGRVDVGMNVAGGGSKGTVVDLAKTIFRPPSTCR